MSTLFDLKKKGFLLVSSSEKRTSYLLPYRIENEYLH